MPAKSITEIIDLLSIIVAKSEATGNRTGYFAALYKKVTIAVHNKIKAGYFDDNERMEKLDIVFASRYLDAYENYYQQLPCTASWRIAFDTCNTWRPMVMHHLLAGMNAHIGLDLGIATATVSQGTPIENIQNDFDKINTVLGELIAEVKTALYSMWPLSRFISKLNMGKFENDMAGFSMNIARDAAWESAVQYAGLASIDSQSNYINLRDMAVARFTQQVLNPGTFVYALTGIFRVFETGTIENKIHRLDTTISPQV